MRGHSFINILHMFLVAIGVIALALVVDVYWVGNRNRREEELNKHLKDEVR